MNSSRLSEANAVDLDFDVLFASFFDVEHAVAGYADDLADPAIKEKIDAMIAGRLASAEIVSLLAQMRQMPDAIAYLARGLQATNPSRRKSSDSDSPSE